MIKRTLFTELKNHLDQKEISLIVGPRQSGKTTLMLLLQDKLKGENIKTVYFNLDIETDRAFFITQETLLKKIELEIGKGKGYVFIDEIQRKENAGLFLKGLYDMNLAYKFIVSGSGSLELKEKIHESLAGRKRVFELTTLSFFEFVNFRTDYRFKHRLHDYFLIEKDRALSLLTEYLEFGGYPRVVLADTILEKRRIISELFQSYIEKDIGFLLGVNKTSEFANLVKVLSSQIGNLVNLSELSSTLGISSQSVRQFLWYLEKTFIIRRITPYFTNIRKEITKSPVFYFTDLGLRNFVLGELGNATNSASTGFLFENFVANILSENIRDTGITLHFWRTKDRAEVDFIIDAGKSVIPIEIKYKKMKNTELSRSFRSFLTKYQPKNAFIVNLTLKKNLHLSQTTIRFILFHESNAIVS